VKKRILFLVLLLVVMASLPLLIAGCGSVGGISAASMTYFGSGAAPGAGAVSGWTRVGIGQLAIKNLYSIFFNFGNDTSGTVVGFETIARTTDGGSTWTNITPAAGDRNTLTNKTFKYYTRGTTEWAIGDAGMVFRVNQTTGAWERWKAPDPPPNAEFPGPPDNTSTTTPLNVDWKHMYWSGSTGVIVGNYPNGGNLIAYLSGDGGNTWSKLDLGAGVDATTQLTGVKVQDAGGGKYRFVGHNTADTYGVFITNEAGGGFVADNSRPHPIYYYRDASSAGDWMAEKDGYVAKLVVTSGAAQWTERSSATSQSLRGVDVYTQSGWAVGDGGQIVTTFDSGNTWNTAQSSSVVTRLNSVIIAKKSAQTNPAKNVYVVYACGHNGVILKTTEKRETTQ
jgi:photosystem II stability/assembly factor-like uncharacterized protein